MRVVDQDTVSVTFLPWFLPVSWKYFFPPECEQRASLVPDMKSKVLGRKQAGRLPGGQSDTLLSSWNDRALETDTDLEVPRRSEHPNHNGLVETESHKLFPWDYLNGIFTGHYKEQVEIQELDKISVETKNCEAGKSWITLTSKSTEEVNPISLTPLWCFRLKVFLVPPFPAPAEAHFHSNNSHPTF